MKDYLDCETTGRHGKPLFYKLLTYEVYCRACNLEENAVSRQLWVQYTRQCADQVKLHELFSEVRMK